ncbi:MAG: hypothetical protein HZB16_12785 [Armatimonadetes bacterium]|nr:hypothetical protein [Armatimonadota bacterium]
MPLVTGLLALVLALVFTPMVRGHALRRGWVCYPRADRWSKRTVALMGGVSIVASVTVASCALVGRFDHRALALLGSSLLMFAVGAVDDRISVKPHTKLISQVVAATILVQSGLRFGLPGDGLRLLDQLLTIFWIVFVGNAFNLLDNMDGLCAGIACVASFCLAAIGLKTGDPVGAALSAAMGGACLGYLRYNRYPASVFMGDCGSLFIGHFLAGATLLVPGATGQRSVLSIVALPTLVMLIPLMDTGLVTVSRKWFGRPISQGGRDHSSHRLVAIGMSEPAAVRLLCAVSAVGGASALAVLYLEWWLASVLLPTMLLLVGLLAWYLLRVRVYDETASLTELLNQTPIPLLAQHRYRRRIGEVLFDTTAIALGLYIAYVLRFEGDLARPEVLASFGGAMPLVLATHLSAYFIAGVYRGIWRYTSAPDLPRFLMAVAMGTGFCVLALAITGRSMMNSRSVLLINALVQFNLLAGTRISLRLMRDRLRSVATDHRPVLLVGASDRAEPALRRLLMTRQWGIRPTGLICEEESTVGLRMMGVPVVGTSHDIRELVDGKAVSEVLLIDDTYPREAWERIRRACRDMGVTTRVVRNSLEPDEGPTPLSAVGD